MSLFSERVLTASRRSTLALPHLEVRLTAPCSRTGS